TVVNDSAFGEADSCVWRLQATAHVDGTRLTAMDNTGVAITTYSRVVNAAFASTYTVGLVFGTAVGYQLTADRCAADGTVLENIISLKFTGGGAGEHAEEAVILDLGVA
ncbi:MAG TPA: hypothetical protein VG456_23490, partial [Candidatus Sulfopaludibacter sp.]|nr:hypothetical protein [Candidatus Sulfopaludibacter sp.]